MKIVIVSAVVLLQLIGAGCAREQTVFELRTQYERNAYRETVTQDDLREAPLWVRGTTPAPLSQNVAESNAMLYVRQNWNNSDEWRVGSARLREVGKDRWIYLIRFYPPETPIMSPGGFFLGPTVIVLMDDRVIRAELIKHPKPWTEDVPEQ